MGRKWVAVEIIEPTISTFALPRRRGRLGRGRVWGQRRTSEVFEGNLPEGVDDHCLRKVAGQLGDLFEYGTFSGVAVDERLVKQMASAIRRAAKVRTVTKRVWTGGGGFDIPRDWSVNVRGP